jgi:hypothetical protein
VNPTATLALPPPPVAHPRPAGQIARRALLLQAVHLRGWIEDQAGEGASMPMARAIDRIVQIKSWVLEHGLLEYCEPAESELLASQLGRLEAGQVTAAYWRMDSLGVLVWALGGIAELPAYDAPFHPTAVLEPLPRLGEPVAAFIDSAGRRPAEECAAAFDAARLWHWRAEIHGGHPVPPEHLESAARRAGALSALSLITDGDFTVMGRPYREIDSHQHELLMNLARERSQALSWVCGDDREDGE